MNSRSSRDHCLCPCPLPKWRGEQYWWTTSRTQADRLSQEMPQAPVSYRLRLIASQQSRAFAIHRPSPVHERDMVYYLRWSLVCWLRGTRMTTSHDFDRLSPLCYVRIPLGRLTGRARHPGRSNTVIYRPTTDLFENLEGHIDAPQKLFGNTRLTIETLCHGHLPEQHATLGLQ